MWKTNCCILKMNISIKSWAAIVYQIRQVKMGLPQITTCCFVFDLKTGNTILGVINAILSFIMVIVLIVVAAMVGSLQSNEAVEADPDAEATVSGMYVICIILVLMYLMKLLGDLMFVYAVQTGKASVIKGYLILWVAFFLLSGFLFFLHILDFSAYTIITQLIYMALNVYAILLAYSFYKQLNTREDYN